MNFRAFLHFFLLGILSCSPFCGLLAAQTAAAPAAGHDADLVLVVALNRHGVRSPMIKPELYNQYSAAPWPKWDVPPTILTAHGYELMKIFGAWDRARFSGEGLFAAAGCDGVAHVTIVADNDQRTRESGKALAEGMFPGCTIPVHSQPDGVNDPLFRATESGAVHPDAALTAAAISGREGGDAKNLTAAYRPQLETLDRILAGCGRAPANTKRTSIFDVPAPVSTGAGLASNLLLEYTQGMSDADTGWGCLNAANLRSIMQLSSANWNYRARTLAVARPYASGLLDRILKTMAQNVTGKPAEGALGKPGDRLVLLVGHDTNIVTVAGALGLNWIEDGLVDDTPPGGALLFEVWRSRTDGKPFIRVVYTAQTLEQMRQTETLSPANPPAEAPVFVPGCGRKDLSCSWEGFEAAMRLAIEPAYVPEKL